MLRGSVLLFSELIVFHSCTHLFLDSQCLCARHHRTNATALAHDTSKKRLMLRSAWDLETKLFIFLFFLIFVLPIYLDPAASRTVSKRNKEGLSADTTNMNVCGDDVHDRAPVCQGHVSVSPFTPFEVAYEPFASQLCLLFALTQGHSASSLCLCLCFCLCLWRLTSTTR